METSLFFTLLRYSLCSNSFQKCCVGQPKPLERVVTRGDRTGNDDFLLS